jgi:LacI family transcriptional regulator, galactose operon repressor
MHYVSPRHEPTTPILRPSMSETFPSSNARENNNHGDAARRPTMREVAALAGVSLSTVSRAINEDPKVAPDLAEKVHRAVTMLGYRRDVTATTLRRADRLSASIGLVFDDVANPFHATLHRGIEDVARARGVLAFAGSSDEDSERERDLVQAFLSRRVDGLIIVPAGVDHGYLTRDRDAGVALVFVDRPPGYIDADVVLSDHAGGARAATAHLLAAGHRRIGYLGDRRRIHSAVERLHGHTEALAAAGVPHDPALVRMELEDSAMARRAAEDLLAGENPPTAVFAAQNLITIGAVEALRARGLQHSVAFVGFDDLTLADAVDPGLTVVAQDAGGIGRAAAEALFARLDGDDAPSRTVVVPTTLIARGSGEIAPGADA